MFRSWNVFVDHYKDENLKMPISKRFLDKASGLNQPIGDEIFVNNDQNISQNKEENQTRNPFLILPIDLYSQENVRVDPPKSQIGEAVEVNPEEINPEEEIIENPSKVEET